MQHCVFHQNHQAAVTLGFKRSIFDQRKREKHLDAQLRQLERTEQRLNKRILEDFNG